MNSLLDLDQQTIFMVDALLLIVFAIAFTFAGLGQKDRRYWACLVASNASFAIAFLLFSQRIGGSPQTLLLPNVLLVVGLDLRWRATRAFFGHRPSWPWFIPLSLAMVLALLLTPAFGIGAIFSLTNALIGAQIIAIIVAIAREREPLPSRWGLMLAYGVVAASSALRVVQGGLLEPQMHSLLPADHFLNLHLIAAAVHISASGAFSLSIAYERSAAGLREAALRDPLTGLYNRGGIELLPRIIKRWGAQEKMAVVLMDIDHFKKVNDSHGHAAGDAAIAHCADLIRRTFRGHSFIARMGGEEFLVLLPGKGPGHARGLADEMRRAMEEQPLPFQGRRIRLTISIGISHGMADPGAFAHLLDVADQYLYRAKTNGRNRIEIDEALEAG